MSEYPIPTLKRFGFWHNKEWEGQPGEFEEMPIDKLSRPDGGYVLYFEHAKEVARLKAQNRALCEALEWALPFALKAPDPSRGKDDVPSPEWLAKKDKACAAIAQAKEHV